MPLEPHLIDQVSEPIDTPHSVLDRSHNLIVAGEWTPYLEGKVAGPTCMSGDLQRRSMQLPSEHVLFGEP
jgi:hypothetical protein